MTIHVLVALVLIGIILLQRSEGGLGSGFGGGGDFLSPRGTANLLTRATAILALMFIATSLVITTMVEDRRERGSIIDDAEEEAPLSTEPPPTVEPITPVETAPVEQSP